MSGAPAARCNLLRIVTTDATDLKIDSYALLERWSTTYVNSVTSFAPGKTGASTTCFYLIKSVVGPKHL